MGFLDWLAGSNSILGGAAKFVGLGDLVESADNNDVFGVLSGGVTRGVGRQFDSISKDVNEFVQPTVDAITGKTAADAAEKAAEIQQNAADKGIDEIQRQFDVTTSLLSNYVGAGSTSLSRMMDLLGLGTEGAQDSAINDIKSGSEYQSLIREGENAILSNASATGGLRGGDIQTILQENRPKVLSELIDKQYQRLGGIASLGQNSAAMTGSNAIGTGRDIASLYQDIGAYGAGAELSKANSANALPELIAKGIGAYYGGGF